ncbi:AlpA family transcriptional regulator [Robiginitalea sp. SC105]|uniref:helix-turn-helix transcriptional regulator n=1 Tax=Robiginitalea sp. SC105 TaxID=2762332 RepID=UPI00163B1EC8|nr:helix-turn-helix domain-containing protein [Robiginitalea sp. SC105]MBC2838863.1 helix-turn-helix domain-containing protein [Robiginitalea sp. SC105]
MVKEILNLEEAAKYTGYSKSHLYKLTHYRKIDHYKPNGKTVFFKKEDLNAYLLQGKREAINSEDVEVQAANYLLGKKRM